MKATYKGTRNELAKEQKYIQECKKRAGTTAATLKGGQMAAQSAAYSESREEHERNGRSAAVRTYKSAKSQEEFLNGWMSAWKEVA